MLDLDPSLRVDPNVAPQDRIQIMDLHSENPVVSYRNQIFTCSWYDLLGTDLVFSFPGECHDIPKLRQGDGFDLISASRVKLLGQKANLISASKDKVPPRQAPQEQQQSSADAALPTTSQGRFLQRLMDAKERKGETDTVRTVFPQKSLWGFDAHSPFWAGARAQPGDVEPSQHSLLYDNEDPRGAVASDIIDPALGGHRVPPGTGESPQLSQHHNEAAGRMFQSDYPAPLQPEQRYDYYGRSYGTGLSGEPAWASYPQQGQIYDHLRTTQSNPPFGESAKNSEQHYATPTGQRQNDTHDQAEQP